VPRRAHFARDPSESYPDYSGLVSKRHSTEYTTLHSGPTPPTAAGQRQATQCHTVRPSFETHLAEGVIDLRAVQVLIGHERLETTMIYSHVARKGVAGVTSPLDLLDDSTAQQINDAVDARGRLNRRSTGRLVLLRPSVRGAVIGVMGP
jgi:hypothetical protein